MKLLKRLLSKLLDIDELKEDQIHLNKQLSEITDNVKEEQKQNDELSTSNYELMEKLATVLTGIDTRIDKLEKSIREKKEVEFIKNLLPVLDGLFFSTREMTNKTKSIENTFSGIMYTSKLNYRKLSFRKMRVKSKRKYLQNNHRKYSHIFRNSLKSKSYLETYNNKKLLDELNSWLEGMQMIQARALDILAKYNVCRIPTVGKFFNPYFHKAVEVEERYNIEDNKIIKEELPGYTINDKVIRYAEVVVGKKLVKEEVVEY